MKKVIVLLIILVISACGQEENQTSTDFTGIYRGTVLRMNGNPPYGFEATVVNNTILTFRCSRSSGSVCFSSANNIKINNDGTFIMETSSTVWTGEITSDFRILGTYVYILNSEITNKFSGDRN